MAIKFPLEMKDGVQVRNISDLKENFDIEKVVGYFLNGKLMTWLEARYYEDEADAVSKLDSDDPGLAQKLCEIFEVEYECEEEIDTEELLRRNQRIAKLKQFTDDDEIIQNVDLVAFDQEELADLYDKDVKIIYLCAGEFSIPKSKQNLDYKLVSNPDVKGLLVLEEKEQVPNGETEKSFIVYDLPAEYADKIGLTPYVETEDYFFYHSGYQEYCKYNKKTKEFCKVQLSTICKSMCIADYYFYAYDNYIVIEPYNESDGNLVLINLDDDKSNVFKIYTSWHGGLKEKHIDNGKLPYVKNEDARIIDLKSGKDIFCFESSSLPFMNYIIHDNKLYAFQEDYYEREDGEYEVVRKLYSLDLSNNMKRTEIYSYKDQECNCRKNKLYVFNDKLYLILHQDSLERKPNRYGFKILCINDDLAGVSIDTILDLNGQNIGFIGGALDGKSSKFIPFVKLDEAHSLNLIDLESKEIIEIATDCGFRGQHNKEYREFCNRYQIVGNYLYYEKGKKRRLYRVDLKTGFEVPVN